MTRSLSIADFGRNNVGGFTPHLRVPIPELRQPEDTEDPVLLVMAPSAGRVLSLGKAARESNANKKSKAKAGAEAAAGELTPEEAEQQTDTMFELLVECACNPDGTPLVTTKEEAQQLPMFVFNRFVTAITGLMTPQAVADQGKESSRTSGGDSPTN